LRKSPPPDFRVETTADAVGCVCSKKVQFMTMLSITGIPSGPSKFILMTLFLGMRPIQPLGGWDIFDMLSIWLVTTT
jgi:hypothetical protein